jgi:hypothetical protein
MKISVKQGVPLRRWLPQALSFFLALQNVHGLQAPVPLQTKPIDLPVVQSLRVITLAGNQAMNDLEHHIMAPLVVEVLDRNDRPVEGADVVFRFPLNGPSGTFAGQKTSQTTRTNSQGQAAATGWTANGGVGRFQVHATATYVNQMGEATISMSNVTRIVGDANNKGNSGSWKSSKWFKIALVAGAAGAVVGIVLATRGSSTSTSTSTAKTSIPTITITPGTPGVGAPH